MNLAVMQSVLNTMQLKQLKFWKNLLYSPGSNGKEDSYTRGHNV